MKQNNLIIFIRKGGPTRGPGSSLLAALLLLGCRFGTFGTARAAPAFNITTATVDGGKIILPTTPGFTGGYLVLNPTVAPSGGPTLSGIFAGRNSSTFLGRFSVSGTRKYYWKLSVAAGNNANLGDGAGHTVTYSNVTYSQASGQFPNNGNPPSSGDIYLGLKLTLGSLVTNPAGSYGGQANGGMVSLVVTQASNPAFTSNVSRATGFLYVALRVDAAIGVTTTANLDFGAIFPGATAGQVQIFTNGSPRLITGGTIATSWKPGGPGVFNVTGSKGSTYTISLTQPGGGVLTGPGTTMAVVLTCSPSASGILNGTVAGSTLGSQNILVGGTLTVGPGQAQGHYSGAYSVIVTYN